MNVLLQLLLVLCVLGMALKLLSLNLWRALLVVAPGGMRLESEEPEALDERPSSLAPLVAQLQALGFVPLGAHREKPRLQAGVRLYDFAHPGERAFASLYAAPRTGHPVLYFLTPLAPDGCVLTLGFKRAVLEGPGRYRSGGFEAASAEQLLQHHRAQCEGLRSTEDFSPRARLEVGRAWYQGPGQREIRRQNLQGLLWTLVALALIAFLFTPRG